MSPFSPAGPRSLAARFPASVSSSRPGRARSQLPDPDALDLSAAPQAPGNFAANAASGALPDDFPAITMRVPAPSTDEGYVFLSPLSDQHSYLIILDPTSGEPVYYQPILPSRKVLDFKRQPNGLLTYYDSSPGVFYGMDSAYSVVRTYRAGNGYRADPHDLQVLPNGHYMLMVLDWHVVDMSQIVPGGHPRAYVMGLIVQELDTADRVVFEWRSWDHIDITETTTEDLTSPRIDYVHGNSLELDYDGNILISARNLDQVLKVNRQTGDVMWRLGGKKNEFAMGPGSQFFLRQHDAAPAAQRQHHGLRQPRRRCAQLYPCGRVQAGRSHEEGEAGLGISQHTRRLCAVDRQRAAVALGQYGHRLGA